MPPKLLWTCGVVPFDLTHGTISGRCGLQHHGLKQKVVCVFHKCREVSEGEMHGMNLGCIVRPWQTLNHTQFYWTNSCHPLLAKCGTAIKWKMSKPSCFPPIAGIERVFCILLLWTFLWNSSSESSSWKRKMPKESCLPCYVTTFQRRTMPCLCIFVPLNAHHCWGFWPPTSS